MKLPKELKDKKKTRVKKNMVRRRWWITSSYQVSSEFQVKIMNGTYQKNEERMLSTDWMVINAVKTLYDQRIVDYYDYGFDKNYLLHILVVCDDFVKLNFFVAMFNDIVPPDAEIKITKRGKADY